MMPSAAYAHRRAEIETYFDRTAAATWAQLTSNAPVSKIRATVRAGRDRMRAALLSWLPDNLAGARVLDAGCGPGDAARALASRGGDVVGVDVSASLIDVARARTDQPALAALIDYQVGDMLDPRFGAFDHVLAMDSLIHYDATEIVDALAILAQRTRGSIVFTHAPRTPLLQVMHAAGRLFPRADRAPAIQPVARTTLAKLIQADARLASWRIGRSAEIASGFYLSHALELIHA
jgi:magnesium-protoporphyrin O-methyltransferase